MKTKIFSKIILISTVACIANPSFAQSVYGGYSSNNSGYSTTTIRPDYSGGYNSSTSGSSGNSSSTIRPDYSGGYTINSHGSSGNSTTTIRPDYSGGYTSSTYSW